MDYLTKVDDSVEGDDPYIISGGFDFVVGKSLHVKKGDLFAPDTQSTIYNHQI
jgi:hypothetical protein